MKKLASLFRSMRQSARRLFTQHSRSDIRGMIREEVREALQELLSDRNYVFQFIRPALSGSAIPFTSGTCTTSPGDINAGNFNCGAYVFLANSASTTPLAVKAAASQTFSSGRIQAEMHSLR